jgi:hypothetical protein
MLTEVLESEWIYALGNRSPNKCGRSFKSTTGSKRIVGARVAPVRCRGAAKAARGSFTLRAFHPYRRNWLSEKIKKFFSVLFSFFHQFNR